MNWFVTQALNIALPSLLGVVAAFMYQKIKKAEAWIDDRDPQTHAILTGAIAMVLPYLGKLIPGWTATDLAGIDQNVIQQVLAWVAMQLTHKKISK